MAREVALSDLVALATRYETAKREMALARRAMLAALANGEDHDAPRPTSRPWGPIPGGTRAAALDWAKAVEAQTVTLLKDKPLSKSRLAATMSALVLDGAELASAQGERPCRPRRKRPVGDDAVDPDLIDGAPKPWGTYEPWIRVLTIPPRPRCRRKGEGGDDALDVSLEDAEGEGEAEC
jgi:hypothetical protein